MFTVIAGLITQAISGATSWLKSKQEIKKAEAENRARLLRDEQTHNQNWEMASLTNAGWKDDVLFYAFLAMFVWAGFDPNGAKEFFENLNVLPEWFVKTWLWMTYGTPYHFGIGEDWEYIVAEKVGAFKIGSQEWPEVNGVIFDFKHKVENTTVPLKS